MCFTYTVTVALNHGDIGEHPGKFRRIGNFALQYNSREKNFPTGSKDYKDFQRNNRRIALIVLFLLNNSDRAAKIRQAYIQNTIKSVKIK